jgi:predicted ATPase with chaperone activity
VARTIADLGGHERVEHEDMNEALGFRSAVAPDAVADAG